MNLPFFDLIFLLKRDKEKAACKLDAFLNSVLSLHNSCCTSSRQIPLVHKGSTVYFVSAIQYNHGLE